MKFFALLICVVLVLSFVIADPITWGTVGANDRLLARNVVSKKAKWLTAHNVIVNYNPEYHDRYATLSGIRLWDFGGRTNFGNARLMSGGAGYRNATIELQSQRGKSLSFTIEYYGH